MEESNFKFLGYRITKIHYKIADELESYHDMILPKINIQHNFRKDNPRFVEVVMTVDVENKSKTFLFTLTIKGAFQADKSMPDNVFFTVYQSNAPAILFPFVRAIIANYTLQANIPPILLPTINFQNKGNKEDTNLNNN